MEKEKENRLHNALHRLNSSYFDPYPMKYSYIYDF